MPINVVCSDCGATYTLADAMGGKKVKCKKCAGVIEVKAKRVEEIPELELIDDGSKVKQGFRVGKVEKRTALVDDDVPTRRGRRQSRDDENSESSRWLLPTLLGGGGVVLAIIVVLTIFLARKPSQPDGQASVVVVHQVGDGLVPVNQPGTGSDVLDRSSKLPPDPPAAELLPSAIATVQAPVEVGERVLFPSGPSPYYAILNKLGDREQVHTLYDMRTGQSAGSLRQMGLLTKPALSPDGEYLAGITGTNLKEASVWSFKTGNLVSRLPIRAGVGAVELVDFGLPGYLVTVGPGSTSRRVITVWDLRTGQIVREIKSPLEIDSGVAAFSPGRRYMARFGTSYLHVFDLTNGAGTEFRVAKEPLSLCDGLAFSNDGCLLACCFSTAGRIVAVDVTQGKIIADHSHLKLANMQIQRDYGTPALQWLSDANGWLLYGNTVIDRVTGQRGLSLPSTISRPVTRDLALVVSGRLSSAQGGVRPVPLRPEAIEAGFGIDSIVPTRIPDWSSVHKEILADAVSWKPSMDAPPKAKGVPTSPISIAARNERIAAVHFARPDCGSVFAFVGMPWRLDRFDTATGQRTESLDLGIKKGAIAPEPPAGATGALITSAISPNGERFVYRHREEHNRLELWSVTEAKPLAGWTPYAREERAHVVWIGFADADHLWSLNEGGKLVLWAVPECKAIVQIELISSVVPALSVTGKYLAVGGTNLTILDALTGRPHSTLESPAGKWVCPVARFRPDGLQLMGLLHGSAIGAGPFRACRWNLETGKLENDIAVELTFGSRHFEWVAADYIYDANGLIDLNLGHPICRYLGPWQFAHGTPDRRPWIAGHFGRSPSTILMGRTLPEENARQITAGLQTAERIVGRGVGVDIQVQFSGSGPELEKSRQRAVESLTAFAKGRGLVPNPVGPLRLTVQVTESATGQTMQITGLGKAQNQKWNVPIRKLACQSILRDSQGNILDRLDRDFTTRAFIGIRRFEGEPSTELLKELWQEGGNWACSAFNARSVYRHNGKIVKLPIEGYLTPGS